VDVGSGGGAPGIPLAAALPNRQVTLLEANGRKCAFLRETALEFPNVTVVQGRAEEQQTDRFGVVLAKALAPPPVAAEWCLPLVVPGGAVVLYVGPSADAVAVSRAAERLGGGPVDQLPGFARSAQGGADAPRLSPPSGSSQEAPPRLVRTGKSHAFVAVAMSACGSAGGQSSNEAAETSAATRRLVA
jgi:16S rRNA (guanine527-N7)-methyltransferase